MKKGKVVIGTLAGLAAGAIAGILFAPKKGSLTRKQIIDKSDAYVDELKSKVNDLQSTISEKFKRTKKQAEEIVDIEKAKFDQTQNAAKNATENLKTDIAADIRHFS